MKRNEFDIQTADGFRLKAIVEIPTVVEKVVIMCHGISSHKQEYLDMFPKLSKKLINNNIASIRFDYRGHGESSGVDLDFSVTSQLIDLETVIKWVQDQKEFNLKPISYVGVSFGGAPGVIHQAIYSTFERISLFAPVISFKETFLTPSTEWGVENFNARAWANSKNIGYILLDGEFRVSRKLLYDFMLIDPISYLEKIETKIEIIHGTHDTLVPCFVAENLKDKKNNIYVNIVENMGHGLFVDGDDDGKTKLSIKIQEEYFDQTVSFLK